MRVAVLGASGRMGQQLIKTIIEMKNVELGAAIDRPESRFINQDAGILVGSGTLGITISSDAAKAFKDIDVAIDFTTPQASLNYLNLASETHTAFVMATTGFDQEQEQEINRFAEQVAIVKSGNMSLGINLLANFVRQAAQALSPQDFDIEILEMHHRHKVDAPSGTAFLLGQAAAKGRNENLDELCIKNRDGITGTRSVGKIGFATLRGGTVVGEHSVIFAGSGERITLAHSAEDRAIFARGALKAALWVHKRPYGLYSMANVLGLSNNA